MGRVKFCAKVIPATLTESKKEEKKAAPAKKEETDEKPAKKEENPLDALPPTTFNLYDFKTFFVNTPDRRGLGMKTFFEQYDKEGYSIYFLHYEKYEGEGQVLY